MTRRPPRSLAGELLESDRRYFEAAADVAPWSGASIVRLVGLEDVAAGCLVQRVDTRTITGDLTDWIVALEARFQKLGCRLARFYLSRRDQRLERALASRGYAMRVETGVARWGLTPRQREPAADRGGVIVRSMQGEADWATRLDVHRECSLGPDGHANPAEKLVELERRKSACGYMAPLLIEHNHEVCGAVAIAVSGSLMRLKNLVLRPNCRGRGIGALAVHQLVGMAARESLPCIGCFAHAGGAAESVYQRCGFVIVTSQYEWTKRLLP